ncbi:acyltransferase family protein [Psychrobacter sp. CAL346-MNA-CIBAN-0220]|uniref:acyltransferase family protein n=1 Tax=Psychrobacter sp. CAL346-MNA-CIBAN-0220 TaxID=3140457 RepID=UPI003319E732
MKFRKDINGLRAFAVIAVVLFHFNTSWMPGGFAGVDVFFVISGFLMTGIIFKGIEQENFSILKFYVARANRIIPALALLCLVLLIFGWFYLTPLEYHALGKHAASSIGFVSNFIYWTEAGYFDAASHEKWLLHTWSLSVEWQFYILYPLVLVAMRKFLSIKTMKSMLVLGTVLGFIFCVIASYKSPNASYYLLPTRAWEMMIGGVAYLYPFTLPEDRKKLVERVGLALVIGSYFLISEDNPWPGYLALFPVVGSFLIIQAQRNDSIITSNIVFQKLGTWSYSIYLWHWPFVVIIYTFSLPEYYIYLGMALSILLGFLSYKYVEKIKFRNDFSNLLSYFRSKPIYIAGIVGVLGSVLFVKSEAFTPYRMSAEQISIVEQLEKNPREPVCGKIENGVSPGCTYGDGPIKAIVVGDSHANAQMVSIGNRATLAGGSILSMGLSECSTIKGLYSVEKNGQNPNYNCGKLVANAIDIAAKKYPGIPVIIINRVSQNLYGANENKYFQLTSPKYFVDKVFSERNDEYRENLTGHMIDTICEFTTTNPVYLVRPTPEMKKNIPLTMFKSLVVNGNKASVKITRDEYNQRQILAFKMQDDAIKRCGAKMLDPLPYLCDSKYCYGDIEGIPLYADDDHLSSYGAEVISPIYDEVFK